MESQPLKSPQVVLNDDAEAPSALVPKTGKLFILNHTGKRILELADGSRHAEDIAHALTQEFSGASIDYVEEKVENFLQESTEKGIVVWT